MADDLDELQKLLDQDADDASIKAALAKIPFDAIGRKNIVSKVYGSTQETDWKKCPSGGLKEAKTCLITYDDGTTETRYGSWHCV